MNAPAAVSPKPSRSRNKKLGFLAWIIAYKATKFILAVGGAVLALLYRDRNLVETAHRWLARFDIDPAGDIGARFLADVARVNAHKLDWAAGILIAYATLYAIEAIGLFFEKKWAEWVVIVQSSLLIPLYGYALIRHFGTWKLAGLVFSLIIVLYLLRRIVRDRHASTLNAGLEASGF